MKVTVTVTTFQLIAIVGLEGSSSFDNVQNQDSSILF
jgi:hypothetical protein